MGLDSGQQAHRPAPKVLGVGAFVAQRALAGWLGLLVEVRAWRI